MAMCTRLAPGFLRPAILPTLRVGWAVRSWLVVQAALAGLGSRSTVATPAGHARVAQEYGILGRCLRLHADPWARPFAAVSAGVLRTPVEGQAKPPGQGHSVLTLTIGAWR
jgi:hypothetical protein